MNQYLFLRRMRGPVMLLIFGVTAILDEYTGVHYSMSWPLYIIAWGVLKLAENAVLAQSPPPPPGSWPGYPPPAGYDPQAAAATPAPPPPPSTSAIVPFEDEERR